VIQAPKADEYNEYYARYIHSVPLDRDLFAQLADQPDDLRALLSRVSDVRASTAPKPGEWSIKEIIGHISDVERILSYRALCIARADTTALPGFEQNDYVRATDFNQASLDSLLEEFALLRKANVLCFKRLTDAELDRQGTASGLRFSVRALLFSLIGHVKHHIDSLKTDYNVGA
jgi:hypothetical protein